MEELRAKPRVTTREGLSDYWTKGTDCETPLTVKKRSISKRGGSSCVVGESTEETSCFLCVFALCFGCALPSKRRSSQQNRYVRALMARCLVVLEGRGGRGFGCPNLRTSFSGHAREKERHEKGLIWRAAEWSNWIDFRIEMGVTLYKIRINK